MSLLKTLIVRA